MRLPVKVKSGDFLELPAPRVALADVQAVIRAERIFSHGQSSWLGLVVDRHQQRWLVGPLLESRTRKAMKRSQCCDPVANNSLCNDSLSVDHAEAVQLTATSEGKTFSPGTTLPACDPVIHVKRLSET